MKNGLKRILNYRPFIWLYLIYRHELKMINDKIEFRKWEKSNDFIQFKRVQPWFKIDGDETLRLNYPLSEDSVIFDVGGYKGDFAAAIINKYNCKVHTFEPIPEFYQIIENKFSNNSKLISHRFGLSNNTKKQKIGLLDNGSSIYSIQGYNVIEIQLKSVTEFIFEQKIEKVDLIKINIEGGEYDLLEGLINANIITNFTNIQVQFHDFVIVDAKERMHRIQEALAATHMLTYQYEFVWENWQLIQ